MKVWMSDVAGRLPSWADCRQVLFGGEHAARRTPLKTDSREPELADDETVGATSTFKSILPH